MEIWIVNEAQIVEQMILDACQGPGLQFLAGPLLPRQAADVIVESLNTGVIDLAKRSITTDKLYRFKNGKFSPYKISSEPPTAKMDEIIIGIADEEMVASGGDCPILTFFDLPTRTGAVIHISAEHIDDSYHECLIDSLMESFDVPANSVVHVLMDLRGLGKPIDERKPWLDEIVKALQKHGFVVKKFTEGEGKDTTLNARDGVLIVEGEETGVILKHNYFTSE